MAARPREPVRGRAALRFALTFGGLAALLFAVYAFPYKEHGISEGWLQGYLRGYARIAGGILSLFDPRVVVDGNVITGRSALSIVKTCDAMEANLLFLAAVLAFPAAPLAAARQWPRKLIAAVGGIAAISALNLTRICSLYAVSVYWPSAFELLHVELWPLLLIIATVALFAAVARWLSRAPAARRGAS
jgi:exosortase/archaeosortase family protein